MENIIEIKNINKSFKDVQAVKDLSFKVKEGEFFAFLGINGAGKSTTISMICGQLKMDSGEIYVDGKNVLTDFNEIKSKIGVVFQNSYLDKDLSVYDNLKYRAALYGICGDIFENRVNQLSVLFDLKDIINRPLKKLSGGQKRRVDIVRALLHNPKILILDEPTTGLDPQTRKQVWEVIHSLRKKQGLTVFLTTHYMEEAADADYIIIIDKGMIAAEGTPYDLKTNYTHDYITLYNTNEELVKSLGVKYETIRDGYKLVVENTFEAKELIIKYPDVFTDFEITKGKMDDVFLNVTGIKLGGNE